jgi:hypothetical protein
MKEKITAKARRSAKKAREEKLQFGFFFAILRASLRLRG